MVGSSIAAHEQEVRAESRKVDDRSRAAPARAFQRRRPNLRAPQQWGLEPPKITVPLKDQKPAHRRQRPSFYTRRNRDRPTATGSSFGTQRECAAVKRSAISSSFFHDTTTPLVRRLLLAST